VVERFQIVAGGQRLEAEWRGPRQAGAPALVLLHEGLGSVSTWRDFPEALARATGLGVFAWSRAGYGKSDPVELPRPLDYMQREGRFVLPEVLDEAGIESALLVGHSDGASIAIVHAGSDGSSRVRGLALLAPHVFCEDVSVESIDKARVAYLETDLRERLQKHHGDNVDIAFWGWNRAWLDPAFRHWNIEEFLPAIDVPVTVVQGAADPYGTLRQVDAIERGVRGRFRRVILPGVGHDPAREARDETIAAIDELRRLGLVGGAA
jgi:pimeloyl-ACP methyl ester carboxylesterase